MEPTVYLEVRAEQKAWYTKLKEGALGLEILSLALLLIEAGVKLPTILMYAFNSMAIICGLTIGYVIWLEQESKRSPAKFYYPKPIEKIGLTQHSLLIGPQEIPVTTLKSIIIECDGYAGQLGTGKRGGVTGFGKLTVVNKSSNEEKTILIKVNSSYEMQEIRRLTNDWRNEGLTAFIMD
ncbi:hypothetical protein [Hymenobacter baengnokdamensis]|uniref:hypothetical protein n=1 Tax=Hymenobacter baengnokdamensis TaxID=2615203 RepID=UPI00124609B1|nr:hypothetical protein [Hymenobacter baengnokdamensis]